MVFDIETERQGKMKTIERTPRPFLHIASEGNSESLVLGVKNIIIQSINHPKPLLDHGQNEEKHP